jgi:hypothetical protein
MPLVGGRWSDWLCSGLVGLPECPQLVFSEADGHLDVLEDARIGQEVPGDLPGLRPGFGVDVDEDLLGTGAGLAAVDIAQVALLEKLVEASFELMAGLQLHRATDAQGMLMLDRPGDHEAGIPAGCFSGRLGFLVLRTWLGPPQRQLLVSWLRAGAGDRHGQPPEVGQASRWPAGPLRGVPGSPAPEGPPQASRRDGSTGPSRRRGRNGPALQAPGWH